MVPRSIQHLPERANFDHTACYRENVHANTKAGRQWCRREGPASRSGRDYASGGKPAAAKVVAAAVQQRAVVPADATARHRRHDAARRYQPTTINLLLVAEAPPAAPERYFYFPEVDSHDSLFRYVARSILRIEPTRANKVELLTQLKDRGVFLIDLKQEPRDGTPLVDYVPDLVERIRRLRPAKIILIKTTVHTAAYKALTDAGFPVASERVPFPGSGQQKRFEEAFACALESSVSPRNCL